MLIVELLLVQLLDWASPKVCVDFDDARVLDVSDAVLELRGVLRVAATRQKIARLFLTQRFLVLELHALDGRHRVAQHLPLRALDRVRLVLAL